jgi:hypothetical protein
VSRAQSHRVDSEWRRKLRVWLAEHDLTTQDIAAAAATDLLHRDHTGTIYLPPPAGDTSVHFTVPDELHTQITAAVTRDVGPHPLWAHGIRSLRDFYLVALDRHMTADSTASPAATVGDTPCTP